MVLMRASTADLELRGWEGLLRSGVLLGLEGLSVREKVGLSLLSWWLFSPRLGAGGFGVRGEVGA